MCEFVKPVSSVALCRLQEEIFLYVATSHWPSGLRRGSAAARVLGLRVRIPPGALVYVSSECCVSSDRGLCLRLITRPEESYRLWCIILCDLETSSMGRLWPASGC
jgi:hypothetical protein